MADKNDLLKKFDVNSILSNLKSMINPENETPAVDPDDALGIKLAEISTLLQQLAKTQAEQAKDFAKVNELINGAYRDIQALRESMGEHQPKKTSNHPKSESKASPQAESTTAKTKSNESVDRQSED